MVENVKSGWLMGVPWLKVGRASAEISPLFGNLHFYPPPFTTTAVPVENSVESVNNSLYCVFVTRKSKICNEILKKLLIFWKCKSIIKIHVEHGGLKWFKKEVEL